MKLEFAKLSPTRNMTLIVTSPVAREEQPAVAEKLMAYGSVFAEQVGFLEEPCLPGVRARLLMLFAQQTYEKAFLAVLFLHRN